MFLVSGLWEQVSEVNYEMQEPQTFSPYILCIAGVKPQVNKGCINKITFAFSMAFVHCH